MPVTLNKAGERVFFKDCILGSLSLFFLTFPTNSFTFPLFFLCTHLSCQPWNHPYHLPYHLLHSHHSRPSVQLLSHVWLFATPWTVTHQAPPTMGFSRQDYWSGLPVPSPGDLPDSGIEPRSPTLRADCRQMLYHLSHQEVFSLEVMDP